MSRSLSGLRFDSNLAGLENYENTAFNYEVPAQSLAAGQVTGWRTVLPVTNTNSISTIYINYAGLETVWRYTSGALTLDAGTYSIETVTYYGTDGLHVETYTINQTGGVVATPQFFVNVHTSLYNAPF